MMKRIIYALSILCALVSCVQEKFDEDMAGEPGVIKVRIEKPELEVKSSGTTYYAYVCDAAAGAISEPIYPLKESGTCIYYNIPKEAEQVLFTNAYDDSSYYSDVDISSPEDGNVKFSNDVSSGELNKELLASYVKGVKAGSSEIYEVSMKRLSAKVTTEFELVDADGTVIANSGIDDITVTYSAAGGEVLLDSEGAVSPLSDKKFTCYLSRSSTTLFSVSEHCLPGVSKTSISVYVDPSSGSAIVYTKPLDLVLEANHHYTVKVKVRQHNANASFELADISVTTSSYSPTMSKVDFFDVSDGLYVGSAAGDEASVTVGTALPYEWTCALTEGSDWFELSKDGNVLKVVSKVANESEVRTGKITLTCDEGYEKVITVGQKLATRDRIVMTHAYDVGYNSTVTRRIYISGENISVKGPYDTQPRLFNGSSKKRPIDIQGLTSGKEVIIEADVITGIEGFDVISSGSTSYFDRGYYTDTPYDSYNYEFENCKYLELLAIHASNTSFDFSGMTSLKRLHLESCPFTSVSFAESQRLEAFNVYDCDIFTSLNLNNVASELSKVKINDCDSYQAGLFIDYKALKSLDIYDCDNMAVVNLTGCSSLESFYVDYDKDNKLSELNVTGCSSLKYITIGAYVYLDKFIHEGADAIEDIDTYVWTSSGLPACGIANLDLSGMTSLKELGPLSALSTSFNVSGCTNLSYLGHIENVKHLDVSNCPLIETLKFDAIGSSEETYHLSGCPLLKTVNIYDMAAECDFSQIPSVKTLTLENMCGTTIKTLNLTQNTKLETLRIDSDASGFTLGEIKLSDSVKDLTLNYLRSLYNLDCSNHPNLTNVSLREIEYLTDLNLSGCVSLTDIKLYKTFYSRRSVDGVQIASVMNLTGCKSLVNVNYERPDYHCRYLDKVLLKDCPSLVHVDLYDASLTSLDFTGCKSMTYLDIRYNSMTADALNSMFVTLPDWANNSAGLSGNVKLGYNPGSSTYDEDAARAKWWYDEI